MNLRIFESLADLMSAAASMIVERAVAAAPRQVAIALSGGTTPQTLYELLGRPPLRDELARLSIVWVVVDERYVPEDDPQSNSGMIHRTLFANGISPAHQFLRFRTELDDPAQTATAFETEWRETGIGDLDVVLLGVGEDGHTASLFPGTTALDVEDRIATEVFVPQLNAWRVTVTAEVIRAAGLRMVLAPGKSKREIIRQIRDGAEFPVTRVTSGLETWWFVDDDAVPPAAGVKRDEG